jgi:tetratricopeptide (TPR) repeat protein
LHVESVAWIAERKDVLSTLCWMLTLAAYVRYARAQDWMWWWMSLAALAAGLMAKPMVVTAPLTLLLFDIWPLRRIGPDELLSPARWWPLCREKIPHFGLVVLTAVITLIAQNREGAVAPLTDVSLADRLATVPVSYVTYLAGMVWPAGLAFFYPRTVASPVLALGSTLVLAAVSALVWRHRARPYLVMGWAWYLVTLFPVSGVMQAGDQSTADRYTYVPLIGIFTSVAWAACDFVRPKEPKAQTAMAIAAGSLLFVWAILAFRQVGTWRDTFSLTRHALAVTRNNHVAHMVLGTAFRDAGRLDEAIEEYRAGVAIAPGYADLQVALGRGLLSRGDAAGASEALQHALRLRQDSWSVHYALGQALAALGNQQAAVDSYKTALRLNPYDADIHNDLGLAFGSMGLNDDAIAEYRTALRLDPSRASAYNNIGMALEAKGDKGGAIEGYQAALRIEPRNTFALTNLGAALSDQGQWDEGARYLQEAIRAGSNAPESYYLLGIARLGQGRRQEAADAFRRALAIRPGWPIAEEKLAQATIR